MDALLAVNMHQCASIIILADHGMANRSCDAAIVMGDVRNKENGSQADATIKQISGVVYFGKRSYFSSDTNNSNYLDPPSLKNPGSAHVR